MTLHPRLPRSAVTATLLLILTLGLGACGGGAGEGGGTDGSASGSEQGVGDSQNSGSPPATATNEVAIVDFAFQPDPVKVKVGTEVTWTNQDGFAHTVTADDKSYDSKNMEKDATFTYRFDTAGTFKYFCAIHNYMTGSVVVE